MNKRGQFQSVLLAIVIIFIFGVVLFFSNRLNDELYTALGDRLGENSNINSSEAYDAITRIQTVENSVWDFAFLGLIIGILLQLVLLSYSTRISIAFFWLYVVVSFIVLVLGVIVSNLWQGLAENAAFATTVTRFPITNTILGSNFPIFITVMIMLGIILLFGKRPGGSNILT